MIKKPSWDWSQSWEWFMHAFLGSLYLYCNIQNKVCSLKIYYYIKKWQYNINVGNLLTMTHWSFLILARDCNDRV